MNYNLACENLDIEINEKITLELLKKQYRLNALRYHPDKNKSPDATKKFQDINASYKYLLDKLKYNNIDNSDNEDDMNENQEGYSSLLFSFLKNIMKNDIHKNSIFFMILQKISNTCENKAIDMLEKIDKSVLLKIYEILKIYHQSFHFSNDFFDKMKDVLKRKCENDECIILNPIIDDLFDNNLYKLIIGGNTYIVPLWHDQLVYDYMDSDIYVKCYPILPENVSIDNNNNIHIILKYNITDIWEKEYLEFNLGKQTFEFSTDELKLTKNQTIVLKKQGISRINTNDIYDISNKSDIILNIALSL